MEDPDQDFSGEEMRGADFSGQDLSFSDFSGATLDEADFSNADLWGSDFSGANLAAANLSGAKLLGVKFSNITLNRSTQIEIDVNAVKQEYKEWVVDFEKTQMWGAIARMYHEIKTSYSENGLVGLARRYHLKERWARRREAKAQGDLRGYSAWAGSLLSRIVTGYGVQLRWTAALMLVVYLVSAAVYWLAGMGAGESLYYSIVTFTTAPPSPPPNSIVTEAVAMCETFGGTLLIVILGYVLGNRERI
jgi:hypothetical protein